MTKAVPDGRAELLEFQMPIFHRALNDRKSFDEAVALAKREPWPEGLTKTKLLNVNFYANLREDKEGERMKRAERVRKVAEEKAKRARKKALRSDNTVKITHIDHTGRPMAFVNLDISPEVRQAIRLALPQRKMFGAAKDRGLSDADALAIAKHTPQE